MNLRSTLPDYRQLIFNRNTSRPGIYDLLDTHPFKFNFFRLQTPKADYLQLKNVKWVIESWRNGKKILHSGLIPTIYNNWYFGDYAEQNGGKKNSFFLLYLSDDEETAIIYYFNQYSLFPAHRNIFISNFIDYIKENRGRTTHPGNVQPVIKDN